MEKDQFTEQLSGYLDNSLTGEERKAFEKEINSGYHDAEIKSHIEKTLTADANNQHHFTDAQRNSVLTRILAGIENKTKVISIRRKLMRITAAAACLILAIGVTWYITRDAGTNIQGPAARVEDIPAPAGTKAMITLSDGRRVSLDSLQAGILMEDNGVQVTKNNNGEISYDVSNRSIVATGFNTLSNPRGSNVVTITLSDGTRVWLNAESSITYPVAFTGDKREVTMTGEAYYEVAKARGVGTQSAATRIPFVVKTPTDQIEVLGTHFNINSYADEGAAKTTLIEGSVRVNQPAVNGSGPGTILKPGEQYSNGKRSRPELAAVMAWKNGSFYFENTSVKEIMRHFSRWYNVEVVYEGAPADRTFYGKIPRTLPLSKALRILENAGIRVKIAGRKLTILP